MAMTQLDKIKLIGVIKKNRISCYNDLYIDSYSNLSIYDFLDTTVDIALRFINSDSSEKQIVNALNAVIFVLVKMKNNGFSIEDDSIYDKLASFKTFKEIYNDNIDTLLDNIEDLTEDIYEVDEETELDEEVQVEQEEIDFEEEYNLSIEQIRELEEKIDLFDEQIKDLEKGLEKKEKKNERLVKKTSDQSLEIHKLKKEVERLKKLLCKTNESSKRYETEITAYQRKLDNSNRENQYLSKELESLKKEQSEDQTKDESNDKSLFSRSYQIVLDLIANNRCSIKDIEKTLFRKGIKLCYREITDIISQIKLRYYVDEKVNNFEKTFHISSPIKKCGENIDFSTTKKCLDIMVISDSHIGVLGESDINTINKVYEYMYKNGIKYLLDLGDFFSFYCQASTNKTEKIYFSERVINDVIENYPQAKDISHLLLGGNHDQVLFRYGLDPLVKLDTARSDFISLGYDYASIRFNHDELGIYHPNFRLDKYTEKKIYKKIGDFSRKVWTDSKTDFDSLYANLYGHFHKFGIANNGIVLVPSISYDRERDGAIHMKIYFDGSGNIESITFIKLIMASKLCDKEKYEYHKVRSYKK